MTKIWSGVVAASFVATVGLSAQQAPPTTSPASPGGAAQQPAPSAQASGQSKTITVSGCIQNAPTAGAAGATGTSGSASTAKFVLATKPASGAAAGGAVGTSGTMARYQLEGDDKQISPHLNHQVEITGTVTGMAGGGASTGAPGGGASSTGAARSGASGGGATQTLKVESVKMVSATCS